MGFLTRSKATETGPAVARSMEAELEWLAGMGEVTVTRMSTGTWWAYGKFAIGVGAVVEVKSESREHKRPADAVAQLASRVEGLVGQRGAP